MRFLVPSFYLIMVFFVNCEFIIDVDEITTTTPKSSSSTTEPNTKIIPPVYPHEVTFLHFTSKFFTERYRLLNPNKTENFSQMFGKIYFFMHGFQEERRNIHWYKPITELILQRYPNAHVVIVDWRKPAAYRYNVTIKTGKKVAIMMGDLASKIQMSNDKPKEITFIGNSLGGQLVGIAAKLFFKTTGKKISRIISLDPAGFPFNTSSAEGRLTSDDAENVVVVHTDEIYGVGNKTIIGTLDFYINGGILQPGCLPTSSYRTFDIIPNAKDPLLCHHARVNDYLVEAIRSPEHFLAKKCKDYVSYKEGNCEDVVVSLGDLETTRRGRFYVDTTGEPPYYRRRIDSLRGTKNSVKP